jgi:hypothetical protein
VSEPATTEEAPDRSLVHVVLRVIGLGFVVVFIGILVSFGLVVRKQMASGGAKTKCSSRLRQVGLAALQYGEDKRFLPHFEKTRTLDGDISSPHTPVSVRALMWYGYHDDVRSLVCTDSDDEYLPVTESSVLEDMRLWGWRERYGDPGSPRTEVAPWRDGFAGGDLPLLETTELSYAYTRRGYNRNVSSIKILGADRGARGPQGEAPRAPGDVGNHPNGWNVLKADATIEFIDVGSLFVGSIPSYEWLSGQGKGMGFLPLSEVARGGAEK